jgi:serine/threonine protein kinase/Tfp pilus assembly protein PilF
VEVKCPICGQVGQVRSPEDPKPAPSSECETLPPHPAADPHAITDTRFPEPLAAEPGSQPEKNPSDRSKIPPAIPGYEILEPLGEGGMGQVYKARQVRLDRIVALKVIHPDYLTNPDAVRRFQREARAAARLAHPHLVTVYDVDEVSGTHFLVMEFVEGSDLGRLVKSQGMLPVSQGCECVRQAALGLQHVHERGLVHRDIKPTNLFLTSKGALIKILDMGLARLNQPGPSDQISSELTQTGAVMGTPAYLAPEQARDSRRVDIRSDIYSLGCTLYFLLAGRVPFPGIGLAEIIVQHQLDEPEPIEKLRRDVPPGVASVIRKMMAKRPEERYQTPGEVAAALAPFSRAEMIEQVATAAKAELPPTAPQASRWSPKVDLTQSAPTEMLPALPSRARPARRRKRLLLLILLFCLAVVLAIHFRYYATTEGLREFFGGKGPSTTLQSGVGRNHLPIHQNYQRAQVLNAIALARNPREYDAAIADLGAAIQLAPDMPEYFANRGRRYILRGQQNSTPEDFDKAIVDFTEAIRLASRMADYWKQRGWAYLNKEDWQMALADVEEAIRLDPSSASCYSNRGWAYKLKGDYAAALIDLDKAIQLDPRHSPAYQLRGDVYLQNEEYEKALANYDKAIQIASDVAAYMGRGKTYLKGAGVLKNVTFALDRALEDLDRAIVLLPNNPKAYLIRSEIYAKLGDKIKSEADYAEAIRLDPKLAKDKK